MSFDAYDGFLAWTVDMKIGIENCNMKLSMGMCDLWGWKYCNHKLYVDVVLSMVRIIMIE